MGEEKVMMFSDTLISLISANISEAQYNKMSKFLQGAAPKYWPAPKEGMI